MKTYQALTYYERKPIRQPLWVHPVDILWVGIQNHKLILAVPIWYQLGKTNKKPSGHEPG